MRAAFLHLEALGGAVTRMRCHQRSTPELDPEHAAPGQFIYQERYQTGRDSLDVLLPQVQIPSFAVRFLITTQNGNLGIALAEGETWD
jgi:hypothetical protein